MSSLEQYLAVKTRDRYPSCEDDSEPSRFDSLKNRFLHESLKPNQLAEQETFCYESATYHRPSMDMATIHHENKLPKSHSENTVVLSDQEQTTTDLLDELHGPVPTRVIKEGWLWRRTTMLKWKPCFAVLLQRQGKSTNFCLYKDTDTAQPFQVYDLAQFVDITEANQPSSRRGSFLRPASSSSTLQRFEFCLKMLTKSVLLASGMDMEVHEWIEAIRQSIFVPEDREYHDVGPRGGMVSSMDMETVRFQNECENLKYRNEELEQEMNALQHELMVKQDCDRRSESISRPSMDTQLNLLKEAIGELKNEKQALNQQLELCSSSLKTSVDTKQFHNQLTEQRDMLAGIQKSVEAFQENSKLVQTQLESLHDQVLNLNATKNSSNKSSNANSEELKLFLSEIKSMHRSLTTAIPVKNVNEELKSVVHTLGDLKSMMDKVHDKTLDPDCTKKSFNAIGTSLDKITDYLSKAAELQNRSDKQFQTKLDNLLSETKKMGAEKAKELEAFEKEVKAFNMQLHHDLVQIKEQQQSTKEICTKSVQELATIFEYLQKQYEDAKNPSGQIFTDEQQEWLSRWEELGSKLNTIEATLFSVTGNLKRHHEDHVSKELEKSICALGTSLELCGKDMKHMLTKMDEQTSEIQSMTKNEKMEAKTDIQLLHLTDIKSVVESIQSQLGHMKSGHESKLPEKDMQILSKELDSISSKISNHHITLEKIETLVKSQTEPSSRSKLTDELAKLTSNISLEFSGLNSKIEKYFADQDDLFTDNESVRGRDETASQHSVLSGRLSRSISPRKNMHHSLQSHLLNDLHSSIHTITTRLNELTQRTRIEADHTTSLTSLQSNLQTVQHTTDTLKRSLQTISDQLISSDQSWRTEIRQSLRFDHDKLIAVERAISELNERLVVHNGQQLTQDVLLKRLQDVQTSCEQMSKTFETQTLKQSAADNAGLSDQIPVVVGRVVREVMEKVQTEESQCKICSNEELKRQDAFYCESENLIVLKELCSEIHEMMTLNCKSNVENNLLDTKIEELLKLVRVSAEKETCNTTTYQSLDEIRDELTHLRTLLPLTAGPTTLDALHQELREMHADFKQEFSLYSQSLQNLLMDREVLMQENQRILELQAKSSLDHMSADSNKEDKSEILERENSSSSVSSIVFSEDSNEGDDVVSTQNHLSVELQSVLKEFQQTASSLTQKITELEQDKVELKEQLRSLKQERSEFMSVLKDQKEQFANLVQLMQPKQVPSQLQNDVSIDDWKSVERKLSVRAQQLTGQVAALTKQKQQLRRDLLASKIESKEEVDTVENESPLVDSKEEVLEDDETEDEDDEFLTGPLLIQSTTHTHLGGLNPFVNWSSVEETSNDVIASATVLAALDQQEKDEKSD